MKMKNKLVYLFVIGMFFLSTVSLVLAEGPAVPAGSPSAGGAAATTAGAGAAAATQGPAGGMFGMFLPFILMFAVIYFLMIRPQQKKMKEHQGMLSQLQHGDEIVTTSGMLGKVTGITDKVVTVEISDNVRVKMLKSQVSQVLKGNSPLKEMTT